MRVPRNSRGYSIAIALLYLVVLSAIFTSILHLVLTEHKQTQNYGSCVQALYAAEAGLDLALAEMNRPSGGQDAWKEWKKSPGSGSLQWEAGLIGHSEYRESFDVTVTSNQTIRSVGHACCPGIKLPTERAILATTVVSNGMYYLAIWREE